MNNLQTIQALNYLKIHFKEPHGCKLKTQKFPLYKQNLSKIGNTILSYHTHVATIDNNKLIVPSYWSKTTTKHINYIAQQLGLQIIKLY